MYNWVTTTTLESTDGIDVIEYVIIYERYVYDDKEYQTMKVYNAMQLKKGAKTKERSVHASITQPVQFLSTKEKDENWSQWNMDWLEVRGLDFLRNNARKILKNYKIDFHNFVHASVNDRIRFFFFEN